MEAYPSLNGLDERAIISGDTPRGGEIFMAWNYAGYVDAVTTRGKAAYELPMYVNTWLAGEDTAPGDYPSVGPQPRVIVLDPAGAQRVGT
jgi:hypothetical protein